jgi:Bardet-Biedl syndrome 5 protein
MSFSGSYFHFSLLRLIPGERLVERIENVEDTKGNNGDKGVLRVTNIRLIWHANSMPRINLSIGYNAVNGVTTRIAKSVRK